MAYVRETRRQSFAFDSTHRLAGLEMTTKVANVRLLAAFAKDFAILEDLEAKKAQLSAEEALAALNLTINAVDSIRARFADTLLKWNMQSKEGDVVVDVPPTAEGIEVLDDEEIIILVQDWMEALSSVADPLEKGSNSGETSLMQLVPMEILSQNQAS